MTLECTSRRNRMVEWHDLTSATRFRWREGSRSVIVMIGGATFPLRALPLGEDPIEIDAVSAIEHYLKESQTGG